ncbi:MAG: PAS domain-containing protein, partial [Flavobacteriales bacterium]|nr:PAS domain-containing protein [Flavobacteriales bacterium]
MKRENKKNQQTRAPRNSAVRRAWDQLTEGMNDVVLKWDGNGRLIYAGKSIEHYTGTSREEYYGKNLEQFDALTGCSEVWRSALSQCAITGKSTFMTKAYNSPKLGKLIFETEVSPDFCEDRIIQGFTAISRNITDKVTERTRL